MRLTLVSRKLTRSAYGFLLVEISDHEPDILAYAVGLRTEALV